MPRTKSQKLANRSAASLPTALPIRPKELVGDVSLSSPHVHPPLQASEHHQALVAKSKSKRLNRNIVAEFDVYFGSTSNLQNWVMLCGDVGIENLRDLTSITKCKAALAPVWVNIWDLMDAKEAGTCPPRRFNSEKELAVYTKKTKRYYPKDKAKKSGPIRGLLAFIRVPQRK